MKLNQVIAAEKSVKSRVYGALTEANKRAQKPTLFEGLSREYTPKDDDGERFPPERSRVQTSAYGVLRDASLELSFLFKLTAQKDWTNCLAFGDVYVDEELVLSQVPITYLLFLEKQLTDLRTYIHNLPVLDDTQDWTLDPATNLYKTAPSETHRTQKLQRPIVLYDATDKHPAQTQLITEDRIVGHWRTVKFSGALAPGDREKYLSRVEALLLGVKMAREQANMTEVVKVPNVGQLVMNFVLGDTPA